ncbi:MAG: hypothetical protein VX346_20360 [Planctomycetota bacterium]|nr:hypothetical protein [Planctomycetota bacterium]
MPRTPIPLLYASLIVQTCLPVANGEERPRRMAQFRPAHKKDIVLPVARNKQRDWLAQRLLENVSSRRQRQVIRTRLERMSPEQIEALVLIYARQLRRAVARLEDIQDQRRHLRRHADQLFWNRRIRYMPVISWLPQGTSFQASGLISADRRSVRISANPIFSRIDRVDLYPLYRYPQPNFQPRYRRTRNTQSPHRPTRNAQTQVWYDGLRTRTDNLPTSANRR